MLSSKVNSCCDHCSKVLNIFTDILILDIVLQNRNNYEKMTVKIALIPITTICKHNLMALCYDEIRSDEIITIENYDRKNMMATNVSTINAIATTDLKIWYDLIRAPR